MARTVQDKDWTWRFGCKGCKTLIEAGPADVRFDPTAQADTESELFDFFVNCPVCEINNFIPSDQVTTGIADAARARYRK